MVTGHLTGDAKATGQRVGMSPAGVGNRQVQGKADGNLCNEMLLPACLIGRGDTIMLAFPAHLSKQMYAPRIDSSDPMALISLSGFILCCQNGHGRMTEWVLLNGEKFCKGETEFCKGDVDLCVQ